MLKQQKLELKSGILLFAILVIWFDFLAGKASIWFFTSFDKIFNTQLSTSGFWLSFGVSFSSFIFVFLVLFFDKHWKWKFKFDYKKALVTILIGYVMIISLSVLTRFLISLVRTEITSQNQAIVNIIGKESKIGQIILVMFFAPIVEESLFRLGAIKLFSASKYGLILGLIVSSLYFGYVHIDAALWSGNYTELLWLIYYGGTGLVFGLVYTYNKNLIPSICLHLLVNSAILLY